MKQSKRHEEHVFAELLKKNRGGHSQAFMLKCLIMGKGQLIQLEADVHVVQLDIEALQLIQWIR